MYYILYSVYFFIVIALNNFKTSTNHISLVPISEDISFNNFLPDRVNS